MSCRFVVHGCDVRLTSSLGGLLSDLACTIMFADVFSLPAKKKMCIVMYSYFLFTRALFLTVRMDVSYSVHVCIQVAAAP